MQQIGSRFRAFSRGASDDSGQKDPRPILAFTRHIDKLKESYRGRDGNHQPQSYVPEDQLDSYWTKPHVDEIGKAHKPHVTIKYDVVKKRCLRLFSILVYLDKVQYFDDLLEYNITDAQLPLKDIPKPLQAPAFKDVLEGIQGHQWLFCPLILDYALLTDLQLATEHVLPFYDEEKIKDGDAAHIYKIKVHNSCNKMEQIEGDEGGVYVLKSYTQERDRKLHQNEAKALTTLRGTANENIVGYHGSFIQNGTFNLVLQFADGGSLLDYYTLNDPPNTPEDIRVFWRSLMGVLKGLHRVHQIAPNPNPDELGEYRGIHEDIKPDNILLNRGSSGSAFDFSPLLADFGHSHFRVASSVGDEMGVDRQGNQTYGAPECSRHARYLLNVPSPIPTAADIFSIGCVISDAASWVLLGSDGRKTYRELRRSAGEKVTNFEDPGYYYCFHDAVNRSIAVDDMHNRIRKECHPQDTITPQVLDLVQEHMLLWDWRKRLTAKALYERFIKFLPEPEQPLDVEPQTSPKQSSSKVKSFMSKVQVAGLGIIRQAQELPISPPFSDGHGRKRSDAMSPADNEDHLLVPNSQDPPASPKLPPRPGPLPIQDPNSSWRRGSSIRANQVSADTLSPYSEASSFLSPDLEGPLTPAGFFDDITSTPKLELTLPEVQTWRQNWKAYQQNDPGKHRIVKILQGSLRGRDHIFFVDNSRTMMPNAQKVRDAFECLAYILKAQDSKDRGSVSLAFTSSAELVTYAHPTTTRLLKELENCTYDRIESMMEDTFGTFIDKEIIARLPPRDPVSGKTAPPNPLSIIVFTNGQWGGGTAGAGVQIPIKRLIDEIKSRNLKRTHVMIQFIRFGNDDDGIRHLSCLAAFGRDEEWDVVDTRPIDGNVCEMLIGSINHARELETI